MISRRRHHSRCNERVCHWSPNTPLEERTTSRRRRTLSQNRAALNDDKDKEEEEEEDTEARKDDVNDDTKEEEEGRTLRNEMGGEKDTVDPERRKVDETTTTRPPKSSTLEQQQPSTTPSRDVGTREPRDEDRGRVRVRLVPGVRVRGGVWRRRIGRVADDERDETESDGVAGLVFEVFERREEE